MKSEIRTKNSNFCNIIAPYMVYYCLIKFLFIVLKGRFQHEGLVGLAVEILQDSRSVPASAPSHA